MWNTILSYLVTLAPVLLSLVSLIVHFFVFHRLKCTKDLIRCLKECAPDYLKNNVSSYQELQQRVESLEKLLSDIYCFVGGSK